ncbi:hypothetical protein JDFR1000234_32 [uncultured archaeal virus]|jgi:hypothetical protein|uniref:Uncharacterized protein n=1 Tax=uncultured archaeal virus TaxID=1960247 RepID=A0A1S5Y309_9VIRU|nr:hypothetical protein JDFR1000234_32 [uncultured archaeal virus]
MSKFIIMHNAIKSAKTTKQFVTLLIKYFIYWLSEYQTETAQYHKVRHIIWAIEKLTKQKAKELGLI